MKRITIYGSLCLLLSNPSLLSMQEQQPTLRDVAQCIIDIHEILADNNNRINEIGYDRSTKWMDELKDKSSLIDAPLIELAYKCLFLLQNMPLPEKTIGTAFNHLQQARKNVTEQIPWYEIKGIPPHWLKYATKLTDITRTQGQIDLSSIDLSFINNQKQLLNLDLRRLNLNKMPELSNLKNLHTLLISWNEINLLPDDFFGNLTNLTELSISRNKLTSLPSSLCKLQKLNELYLSFNKLKQLPENFGNLKNLKYVDLSHNKLTELPPSFADLTNLEELDLGSNKLDYKTIEIVQQLTNLKKLGLGSNDFDNRVIEGLKKLTKLTDLGLQGSQKITPEEIEQLKKALPNTKIRTSW